jgi:hypothetical protein
MLLILSSSKFHENYRLLGCFMPTDGKTDLSMIIRATLKLMMLTRLIVAPYLQVCITTVILIYRKCKSIFPLRYYFEKSSDITNRGETMNEVSDISIQASAVSCAEPFMLQYDIRILAFLVSFVTCSS